MIKKLCRRIAASLAVPVFLTIALPGYAQTWNPVDLITEGGLSLYENASEKTQLFIDRGDNGNKPVFWVKVRKIQESRYS